MIPVYVPTIGDSQAVIALRAEGVAHQIVPMLDEFSYGLWLATIWRTAASFMLVEHDIAPWPGALDALARCGKSYCGYYYPLSHRLGGTLGCVKFGAEIMQGSSETATHLDGRKWWELDGIIASDLLTAFGVEDFHVHWPAVAHLHDYA